jgi:acetyltransferase-like isoleucine patch superfamily enzyme
MMPRLHKSHGTGEFEISQFKKFGSNVIFEKGVLVFHPETIELGNNIYIGHNTILKGYYNSRFIIDEGTWIGQLCFFHSAGNIIIGKNVGIGPCVKIITSFHGEEGINKPILHSRVEISPVIIEDDADIGIGAIILPGVKVGKGAQIGAGAVVTTNIDPHAIAAGIPAKIINKRQSVKF